MAPPVAEAPVEAPVAIEDVTIRPIAPKPSLFLEPVETVAEAAPAPAEPEKPFIPPQAERPALRAPRMPRIEELPIPAQNQIRARQAETPAEQAPQAARVAAAAPRLGRPRPPRGGGSPGCPARTCARAAGRSAHAEGACDAAAAARA